MSELSIGQTSASYQWYALDGSKGHDLYIERCAGRYQWVIHSSKYPDPPKCLIARRTPEGALAAAKRAMRRYRRPFT